VTSIPIGLLAGLAALAGTSLGVPGALATALLAAGFIHLDSVDWRSAGAALSAVIIVAMIGAMRSPVPATPPDPHLDEATSVVGVVSSMPNPGARSETALFAIDAVTLPDGTTVSVDSVVLAAIPKAYGANVGDRLVLTGAFTPLEGLEPGYRHYVIGRQAAGVFVSYGATIVHRGSSPRRLLVDLRRELTDRLRRAIPGDAGALAAGIVTGEDSALGEETEQDFRTAGLSHVTAVSGQNIAMLAGLLALLARGQSRRARMGVQIVIIAATWLYVGMPGFGAPAIRAGCFVTLAILAVWCGRRPDFLTIVALVSGGMVLIQPSYVASVSFWLSAAASAALVTVFGWPAGGVGAWAKRSLTALATAQLATMPIAIATFGAWSPGSIPANLIVAPLMQVAFPLCFLLAAVLMVVPAGAPVIALAAEMPLVATLATARIVASWIPKATLAAGGAVVVAAVAIPCGAFIAVMSEDVRRWSRRQALAVAEEPATLARAMGGILAGAAVILAGRMLLH